MRRDDRRASRRAPRTASVFGADSIALGNDWHSHRRRALQPDDRRQPRRAAQRPRSGVARRRPLVRAPQPRPRRELEPEPRGPALRRLQRGQPHADRDRARLRQPGAALQAAERDGRRSAAAAGRDAHRRGRRARRDGGGDDLARRRLSCRSTSDDLLFVSSERVGAGLLPQLRPDAPPGRRARRGDARRPLVGRFRVDAARRPLHERRTAQRHRQQQQRRRPRAAPARSTIAPGDRLPLVPRQIFKASLALALAARDRASRSTWSRPRARRARQRERRPRRRRRLLPGPRPLARLRCRQPRRHHAGDRGAAAASRASPTCSTATTQPRLSSARPDSTQRTIRRPALPGRRPGRYALRNSTFYAPGAPRLFSLGIRYAFD